MTEKRLPRPRDPVQLGKLIGDILTGQVEDRAANHPSDPNKNQAAVELGRKGRLQRPRPKALAISGLGLVLMPTRSLSRLGMSAVATAKPP
jgi:hypothetical protein